MVATNDEEVVYLVYRLSSAKARRARGGKKRTAVCCRIDCRNENESLSQRAALTAAAVCSCSLLLSLSTRACVCAAAVVRGTQLSHSDALPLTPSERLVLTGLTDLPWKSEKNKEGERHE